MRWKICSKVCRSPYQATELAQSSEHVLLWQYFNIERGRVELAAARWNEAIAAATAGLYSRLATCTPPARLLSPPDHRRLPRGLSRELPGEASCSRITEYEQPSSYRSSRRGRVNVGVVLLEELTIRFAGAAVQTSRRSGPTVGFGGPSEWAFAGSEENRRATPLARWRSPANRPPLDHNRTAPPDKHQSPQVMGDSLVDSSFSPRLASCAGKPMGITGSYFLTSALQEHRGAAPASRAANHDDVVLLRNAQDAGSIERPKVTASSTGPGADLRKSASGRTPSAPLIIANASRSPTKAVMAKMRESSYPASRSA